MGSGPITQTPGLAQSRSRARHRGRGGVTVTNGSIINCGTAVRMDGGHLTMTGIHIEKCRTVFEASGDARVDASHMSIDKCETVFKEVRK